MQRTEFSSALLENDRTCPRDPFCLFPPRSADSSVQIVFSASFLLSFFLTDPGSLFLQESPGGSPSVLTRKIYAICLILVIFSFLSFSNIKGLSQVQCQGPSGLSTLRLLRPDPVLHLANNHLESQHVGAHCGKIFIPPRGSHPTSVGSGRLRGRR